MLISTEATLRNTRDDPTYFNGSVLSNTIKYFVYPIHRSFELPLWPDEYERSMPLLQFKQLLDQANDEFKFEKSLVWPILAAVQLSFLLGLIAAAIVMTTFQKDGDDSNIAKLVVVSLLMCFVSTLALRDRIITKKETEDCKRLRRIVKGWRTNELNFAIKIFLEHERVSKVFLLVLLDEEPLPVYLKEDADSSLATPAPAPDFTGCMPGKTIIKIPSFLVPSQKSTEKQSQPLLDHSSTKKPSFNSSKPKSDQYQQMKPPVINLSPQGSLDSFTI
ncbi:hypothetical protein EDD86DRAFT_276697 [Gorgonomyces haynaldii]|nr:hypothetical protein EDD86DRAFT_276697 [Gorgonomyces haynaldii]